MFTQHFSTISTKGQMVIPQEIRQMLNLKPQTQVVIEPREMGFFVKPCLSLSQIREMMRKRKIPLRSMEFYRKQMAKKAQKKYDCA